MCALRREREREILRVRYGGKEEGRESERESEREIVCVITVYGEEREGERYSVCTV